MKLKSDEHQRRFDPAVYTKGIRGEEDNPYIEALPPIASAKDFRDSLVRYLPKITIEDRAQSPEARMIMLGQLREFYQPTNRDVDLALRIQTMMRVGYLERNPFSKGFSQRLLRGMAAAASNRRGKRQAQKALGIAILGMSGIGKTTTLKNILDCTPVGASHTHHPTTGRDISVDQLFQLHVSCPKSATLVGLLRKIIAAFDELLGETYAEKFGANRATSTQLEICVQKLCTIHGVGVIVIDELQNVRAGTPEQQKQFFNFLTGLMNDWSVPVVLIATDWATKLFGSSFMVTRRAGAGAALFTKPTLEEFRLFMRVMWAQQLVDEPVPFDESWLDLFWEITCGIYDIAVKLFVFTQQRALRAGGRSTITAEGVRAAWTAEFKLLHAMMRQIRAGRDPVDERFENALKSVDPFDTGEDEDANPDDEFFQDLASLPVSDDEETADATTPREPSRPHTTRKQGAGEAVGKAQRPDSDAAPALGMEMHERTLEQIVENGRARGLTATEALKQAASQFLSHRQPPSGVPE